MYKKYADKGVKLAHSEISKGGEVKRKDIIKKLRQAGFTFKEGGGHTKAYDATGRYKTTIPRHTEINEGLAEAIEKQTGVKLF